MAKKSVADPLHHVASFDPNAIEVREQAADSTTTSLANRPISPLEGGGGGLPAILNRADFIPVELLLQEAQRQVEQAQAESAAERAMRYELERQNYHLGAAAAQTEQIGAELAKERQIRLALERQIAALEVEVKDVQRLRTILEEQWAARLELERKTASLEIRAEKAEEWAGQLAEERRLRLELERQKATLDVEVRHAKKQDVLLTEERQARMNAQSRAAAAEARLAKFEGEMAARHPAGEQKSLWSRLRGR